MSNTFVHHFEESESVPCGNAFQQVLWMVNIRENHVQAPLALDCAICTCKLGGQFRTYRPRPKLSLLQKKKLVVVFVTVSSCLLLGYNTHTALIELLNPTHTHLCSTWVCSKPDKLAQVFGGAALLACLHKKELLDTDDSNISE